MFRKGEDIGVKGDNPIAGLDINMLLRFAMGPDGADEDTVMAAGGDAAMVTCPGAAAMFCGEGAAIIVRGGGACATYIVGTGAGAGGGWITGC